MTDHEQLFWTKPNWLRREFVLTRGGAELARLTFGGWGSSAAMLLTQHGSWAIRARGFWRSTVMMEGAGALPAAQATWSGNYDLDAPFDGVCRWSCLSIWTMRYGWRRPDGAPLIVYRAASLFSQRLHLIDVLDDAPLTQPRLLLIALGGYLLQRTQEDMAATAIVVAS